MRVYSGTVVRLLDLRCDVSGSPGARQWKRLQQETSMHYDPGNMPPRKPGSAVRFGSRHDAIRFSYFGDFAPWWLRARERASIRSLPGAKLQRSEYKGPGRDDYGLHGGEGLQKATLRLSDWAPSKRVVLHEFIRQRSQRGMAAALSLVSCYGGGQPFVLAARSQATTPDGFHAEAKLPTGIYRKRYPSTT